ncbi:hypothetical protein [Streptomyces tubbatahanensis]|nr:hypothetical protein [Streptomyces tubbatahanensis]
MLKTSATAAVDRLPHHACVVLSEGPRSGGSGNALRPCAGMV